MDHQHMDHSQHMHHAASPTHDHGDGGGDGDDGHVMDGCSSMHMMVFHTSVCQDILFKGWTSTTTGEMVGACVAVFIAGMLYEGLKAFREYLFTRGASKETSTSQMNITKQECGPNGNCSGQKVVKYKMISMMHAIQTLLHMFQVFFSYLLMLIFMTYNVWLCLTLILGTGLGYFLFAWIKQSVVDMSEHCQ